ncbi:hypothetical protein DQG13_17855 [Paenibacillus sp. YN15]|nr:hypothetical protein DQG13_17855 [Paenibacillus sp. YN15]
MGGQEMSAIRNNWMKKTLTGLLLLLILTVAVSAVSFYLIFTGSLKEQLNRTNMELVKQVEHKLELVLQSIDNEAVQLVQYEETKKFFDENLSPGERTGNDFRVGNHIDRMIRSDSYIFSIDVYSYRQNRLVSGDILTDERKLEDYSWISQFERYKGYSSWLPARRLYITQGNSPTYRNVVTLVRTYPLIHSEGARQGAIAFNIKEEMLHTLIQNTDGVSGGERGLTFVVDRSGQVVLHTDKSKLGKDISQYSHIAKALSPDSPEGFFAEQVDGQPSQVFYTEVPYAGWRIIRIVSDVQVNKQLTTVRNTFFAIAGGILLLSAALALILGRWTFQPLNRFLQSVSAKLSSNPHYAPADPGKDDLQFLEATFENLMANSETLRKQMRESQPILKWQLIMELLSDYKMNFSNARQYMDMLGIDLYPDRFIAMAADYDGKKESMSGRDLHLYNYALCNVAEELMQAEGKGVAIELENGTCALLISFEEGDKDAEVRAVAVAELIKSYVEENFKRTVTIGIGGLVDSMKDIHHSYKQALESIAYRLALGGNMVITLEDVQHDQSPHYYKLMSMTDSFMDSMKLLEAEKLQAQIQRWFDALAQYNISPEMIRQLNLQCLMKAAMVLNEAGVDPDKIRLPEEVRETLNQYDSLEGLQHYLVQVLSAYMEQIRTKRSNREKSDLILRVLDYIQANYSRADLSLNLLAEEFGVSVSHLSKVFKEQAESNFIDYLMELRLTKAKQLLEETDGKVRDIAEAVGYSNVNSFVRIFKKLTALTPSEYRERKVQKD